MNHFDAMIAFVRETDKAALARVGIQHFDLWNNRWIALMP